MSIHLPDLVTPSDLPFLSEMAAARHHGPTGLISGVPAPAATEAMR